MYSARYSFHEETWFQTVFKIQGIVEGTSNAAPLRELMAHIDLRPRLCGGVRLTRAYDTIARLFILQSSTEQEADVLEGLVSRIGSPTAAHGNTVIAPNCADDHDGLLRDFPRTICWCRSTRYDVGSLNVAERFSILDHFSEIFAAVPTGLNFTYQINFKPLEFDSEEIRHLRKLIARISIQQELPEAFRSAYTDELRKALKSELMSDEFIAVSSAGDARFFERLLARLHDRAGIGCRIVYDGLFVSDDSGYQDFLETGIHSDFCNELDCLDKSALSVDRHAFFNLVFFENDPNDIIMTMLRKGRADRGKKKILFLAANPENTARLRIDAEVKRIDDGLQAAKYRESFELRSKWAITVESLTKAMLDEEPRIVHFSTHGESEGILIEGSAGRAQLIPIDALVRIFRLFKGKVECVILNACYSEEQAIAISKNSIYVVGMRSSIGDDAAIAFSVGFYQSLGAGKDYPFSFDLGVTHVMSQDIDQKDIPVLWFDGKKVS